MEAIRSFEDLEVWKEGMRLSIRLYTLLRDCKDFGFRDQVQRAGVSIPSNIAEGYERQTNKEFIQFLFIARGSCAEVRTQIYLARELGYLSKDVSGELLDKSSKISAMLSSLIKTRKVQFE